MNLNCKKGDLAIIVRSDSGNEGKIVQCLELIMTDHAPDITGSIRVFHGGVQAIWRIDRSIKAIHNISREHREMKYCRDSQLRPLRGDLNDNSTHRKKELNNG